MEHQSSFHTFLPNADKNALMKNNMAIGKIFPMKPCRDSLQIKKDATKDFKTEQPDFQNEDESDDSTSTFVLKEEPDDLNEFSANLLNYDKTVDTQQNVGLIKQEPNEDINEMLYDDENIALNEILENFLPNVIETKIEPVESNDSEILPFVSNKTNIVATAVENIHDTPKGSVNSNLIIEPTLTDSSESTKINVTLSEDNTTFKDTNHTEKAHDDSKISNEEAFSDKTAKELERSQNLMIQVYTSDSDEDDTITDSEYDITPAFSEETNQNKEGSDNVSESIQTLGNHSVKWHGNQKIIRKTQKRLRTPKHLCLELNHIGRNSLDPKRRRLEDRDRPLKHEDYRNNIFSKNLTRCEHSRIINNPKASSTNNKPHETINEKEQHYRVAYWHYGFTAEFIQSLGLQTHLTNTISVIQLHECVDKDKLHEVFSLAGHVKRIEFNCEQHSAKIEYNNPIEAVQAIYIFRNQTLFDEEIDIQMDYSPMSLPGGLSGINNGFLKAAGALKRFWTRRECVELHETDNSDPPDQFSLGNDCEKRTKIITPIRVPDYPTISSTTVPITNTNKAHNGNCDDESSVMDLASNEENIQTADDNTQAIEELGAILKLRGLIPSELNCKDAKSILTAIKSNPVHQSENKIIDNNRENSNENLTTNAQHHGTAKASALEVPQPEHSLQQASINQNGDKSSQHMPSKISSNSVNGTQHSARGVPKTMSCSIPIPPSLQEDRSGQGEPPTVLNSEPPAVSVVPKLEPSSPQQLESERQDTTVENRDLRLKNSKVEDSLKRTLRYENNLEFDKGRELNQKSTSIPKRLIFRNLPPGVTEAELSSKMCQVGDLLYCEGPTKNGLAIVAFSSFQDAERCLRILFSKNRIVLTGPMA
ncbi:hypothetical protein O0L34_g15426 [Tuta absoluta]|nr:hypothetical protein O0L34_g15426 [Tuta absoluta]